MWKPQKVKPTPSWGDTGVGDYQVLSSSDENNKQIPPHGVPFDDDDGEDFNLNLAIREINNACAASAANIVIRPAARPPGYCGSGSIAYHHW